MKQEKKVMKNQEMKEVKGGIPHDRYCPDYQTCPYSNPNCYYQQLPGGYMLPCILA